MVNYFNWIADFVTNCSITLTSSLFLLNMRAHCNRNPWDRRIIFVILMKNSKWRHGRSLVTQARKNEQWRELQRSEQTKSAQNPEPIEPEHRGERGKLWKAVVINYWFITWDSVAEIVSTFYDTRSFGPRSNRTEFYRTVTLVVLAGLP